MLISDITLAILRVMEAFLIVISVMVVINQVQHKLELFRRQQRALRKEEEDVERFINELYEWAKTNSNLISVR